MYNFRLVLYVWVLSIIGILVINSAADGFAAKQLIGFVGGSVVMIIFSLIDYNYIAKFEWYLYSINIGMLIAVKLFGISVNGARRWFSLGPFGTFQPSELSNVIMLIIFASVLLPLPLCPRIAVKLPRSISRFIERSTGCFFTPSFSSYSKHRFSVLSIISAIISP